MAKSKVRKFYVVEAGHMGSNSYVTVLVPKELGYSFYVKQQELWRRRPFTVSVMTPLWFALSGGASGLSNGGTINF